jgi:hypothetical protein
MITLRPDEIHEPEPSKPRFSMKKVLGSTGYKIAVLGLAAFAISTVAGGIKTYIDSRTSSSISSVVRKLDSEQTVNQALANYSIFSNLETIAQRDGYARNITDDYLIPQEVTQNYHEEVHRRIIAEGIDADNYDDVLKIEEDVIKDDTDLQPFLKGEGQKKLETIIDDLKPCVDEIYPDNTIHAGSIQFSDYTDHGGEYSHSSSFLNGLVVIDEGEITISSVLSVDAPMSEFYDSVSHELAHSFETSDYGNETKTQVRAYNILACAANKGSIPAEIALFKTLKYGAWLYAMQNAKTEKNNEALETYKDNALGAVTFAEYAELKDKDSIRYSLNPFGYVLELLIHGKKDLGWTSLDAVDAYVGSRYNAEALRQFQRNDIMAKLPNLHNLARGGTANASSFLLESYYAEEGHGTRDDPILYFGHSQEGVFWPDLAADGDVNTAWKPYVSDSMKDAFFMLDLGPNIAYNLLRIFPENPSNLLQHFRIETTPTCAFAGEQRTVFESQQDYSSLSQLYSESGSTSSLLIPIPRTTDRCIRLTATGIDAAQGWANPGIREFEVYGVP